MSDGEHTFRGRPVTPLGFGTSGLRGLVTDITDLEAFVNTLGFLEYLIQVQPNVARRVVVGGDLRPSTDSPDRSIMRAVAKACTLAGFEVVNAGKLPTPAVAFYGFEHEWPSIVVTGSHIPFDRNGIKFNMPQAEVLKADEAPILRHVAAVRAREYARSSDTSPFDDLGMFRPDALGGLPPVEPRVREAYLARYQQFFPAGALQGVRVGVYQHSAVGRDLLLELLTALGAEAHPVGRSEHFVAIDTEAIDSRRLRELEQLHRELTQDSGQVDAIVSTDGDSDRPLVLGVNDEQKLCFVPGDLLGVLVADYLEADAVAVPISASDAIEAHLGQRVELVKTRIGSPWVIAAMQGLQGQRRVGWEANGGFLLGSMLEREGRQLRPLATRDAVLPIVCVLHAAKLAGANLEQLVAKLPRRFSQAGLIDVARPVGELLAHHFTPREPNVLQVEFQAQGARCTVASGESRACTPEQTKALALIRDHIGGQLAQDGFGVLERIDFLDGIRCFFDNGDVAHIRASGNAPQLRMYAVAASAERAQAIVEAAVKPGGSLSRLVRQAEELDFVQAIARNIEQVQQLFERGEPPSLIGTVSGSPSAQRFWQQALHAMQTSFRADVALSLHEDLPTNQALGLLLMWQRLREVYQPGRGALLAFVFGEGSRATPFTEAECGQKPALTSFVRNQGGDFQSMVALAMRCFAPVEAFLRRSGFEGVLVKWGDEVQIPARDLSHSDELFRGADIVRFVSLRQIGEDDARSKDWVGVAADGRVTAFIPRRPLDQMWPLAKRGLLQVRGQQLYGGINLGSIAVSRLLLELLLEEFEVEVNDANADRKQRPDLDPQFFSILMLAMIDDEQERASSYAQNVREVPALAQLEATFPNLLGRLRQVLLWFRQRHGRPPRIVAMDFGDQYWGDIGQHPQIYRFYMALNDEGPEGRIARALAGIEQPRDAGNNLIVDSVVGPHVRIENSVVIGCHLSGTGLVEDSVLIGSCVEDIQARAAFDVLSSVRQLTLQRRAGSYRVIHEGPLTVAEAERVTSLFLPDGREVLMRVDEACDLRDRAGQYEQAVFGNPLSFSEAHELMGQMAQEPLQARRAASARRVLARFSDK